MAQTSNLLRIQIQLARISLVAEGALPEERADAAVTLPALMYAAEYHAARGKKQQPADFFVCCMVCLCSDGSIMAHASCGTPSHNRVPGFPAAPTQPTHWI